MREYLPPEVKNCATFWDWEGPRLSAPGRNMMLNTQVSAVHIDGDHATAAFATGGSVTLAWKDGHWRLN
jgi:hypothetical protein